MKLYQFLSGISFLKRYNIKLMFVAFLGLHIPLLGIIFLLILNPDPVIDKTTFFLLSLGLTLLATAITLFILNALVSPLKQTQYALREYIDKQTSPRLPEIFNDELGLLMQDINRLTTLQASDAGKGPMVSMLIQTQEVLADLSARSRSMQKEKDAETLETTAKAMGELIERQRQQIQTCLHEINTGTVR